MGGVVRMGMWAIVGKVGGIRRRQRWGGIAVGAMVTAKEAAYNRYYYLENQDRLIEKQRAYRLANHDKVLASKKAYRDSHKEEIALRKKEYLAKKKK